MKQAGISPAGFQAIRKISIQKSTKNGVLEN